MVYVYMYRFSSILYRRFFLRRESFYFPTFNLFTKNALVLVMGNEKPISLPYKFSHIHRHIFGRIFVVEMSPMHAKMCTVCIVASIDPQNIKKILERNSTTLDSTLDCNLFFMINNLLKYAVKVKDKC